MRTAWYRSTSQQTLPLPSRTRAVTYAQHCGFACCEGPGGEQFTAVNVGDADLSSSIKDLLVCGAAVLGRTVRSHSHLDGPVEAVGLAQHPKVIFTADSLPGNKNRERGPPLHQGRSAPSQRRRSAG